MRYYEAMYIVDSDMSDEALESVMQKYAKIVTDSGGEVLETGKWEKGVRPLAYAINRKTEGLYVLMQFKSDTSAPRELDRVFRISDDVARHLIVRQNRDED